MPQWMAVCRVEQIREGQGAALDAGGVRLAVFRQGDEWIAFSGRCPHSGGPLGHGWIEAGEVVCPLHHWRFRLSDGRCTTIRGESVHKFPCEARGDLVWVEV
jgi:nitrite reductase (NADH) small subunit